MMTIPDSDSRFFDYFDPMTSLEWLVGSDEKTNWLQANEWVEKQSENWRMPTVDEIKTLYKLGTGDRNMPHEIEILTSGWYVWSGETTENACSAWVFYFYNGTHSWQDRLMSNPSRAFAVRSRK